jgi:hypothetical protein
METIIIVGVVAIIIAVMWFRNARKVVKPTTTPSGVGSGSGGGSSDGVESI